MAALVLEEEEIREFGENEAFHSMTSVQTEGPNPLDSLQDRTVRTLTRVTEN